MAQGGTDVEKVDCPGRHSFCGTGQSIGYTDVLAITLPGEQRIMRTGIGHEAMVSCCIFILLCFGEKILFSELYL